MNLTKDDLMRLPKERLAEMILEKDKQQIVYPINIPPVQVGTYTPPCFTSNGVCTNPRHDCINCPREYDSSDEIRTNTSSYTE